MNRELSLLEKLEKDLNLKQLQIRSLLTITQAINDNVSQDGLFNMYKSFLSWEMGIEKMALFVMSDDGWQCSSNINFENFDLDKIMSMLLNYKRLHTIKKEDGKELQDFNIVIPVFHKENPISYSIIGGIKEKEDLYNKIQFITTITNIIAVAIENKRLFKQQIEQEKYRHELQLAKEVQSMLIPDSLPVTDRYEISSIYKPHYNIGGDYLDFIPYDKDRFALCIADISGKGVAAALLMANFQAMIQSLIFQYKDLETFIMALNQAVYRITKSDKFITFFVVEVDVKNKVLRYVNAGHYPPVLFNEKGEIRRLKQGCTVIGAFDRLDSINEERIELEPNMTIMSFTDGLADLINDENQYFEETRLHAFIKENCTLNPQAFNDKLLEEIESYRQNQNFSDDIAVMTCKIF